MVVDMEYHKGSFCDYASVFCQEGYCSGCEIYLKMTQAVKQVDRCEERNRDKLLNLFWYTELNINNKLPMTLRAFLKK